MISERVRSPEQLKNAVHRTCKKEKHESIRTGEKEQIHQETVSLI